MRGPKPQRLVVEAEDIEIFQQNLRTGKTEHRVARRSQILLLRAEGYGPSAVAQRSGCDRTTVWRVAERYRQERLEALCDRPRPGRPRHFSPAAENTGRGAGVPQAL
jgi:hypothetical protein